VSKWRTIDSAPKGSKSVLLLLGETIPEMPDIRVGGRISGKDAEELGYRGYAKYGGWLIWNAGNDFYVVDAGDPTHWMPLPEAPKP